MYRVKVITLAEVDWHMPLGSYQYLIILFVDIQMLDVTTNELGNILKFLWLDPQKSAYLRDVIISYCYIINVSIVTT